MSLTVYMYQEAFSTYRLVTPFLTNWNFLNLPSLSLTNRAYSESAFLVLKTHASRAFLRTNTEPKVSSFIRLNKIVFSTFLRLRDQYRFIYRESHSVRIQFIHSSCYVSSSIIKFVSLLFCLFCVYNSFSSSSFSRLNRTTRHSVELTHTAFYVS
jgi:hypothetical protein